MLTFLYFMEAIVAAYLLQPSILLVYYFLRRSKGFRPGATPAPVPACDRQFQFGIIITVHDEIDFIPPIVDSLLKQTYPFFNVYVVADACNISSLHYADERIHLLSPGTPLNCQVASLEFGFHHFQDADEICIIFDPDNLVHPQFLEVLNKWYNAGYLAVQGNLKAKNQEGVYARIDGLGMTLANFVDRISRSMLDLSANTWGCGISIHRKIYQKITYDEKCLTGGFDKHMQAELVLNVPRIGYATDALFYDEKVDDSRNFEQQRIRWIATYFKFLGKSFSVLFAGLKKFDFNLSYFGFNLVRPPYFLLLLSAVLMLVTGYFIHPLLAAGWLLVLGSFTLSCITIVSMNTRDWTLLKSLVFIPVLIFRQVRALLRYGAGKKTLLKTRHSKVMYIEELLEKSPWER
jgi:cellulose synthase/poly-beta-1,6-N-acetylglucosamine synthase-like glycosyltransferase